MKLYTLCFDVSVVMTMRLSFLFTHLVLLQMNEWNLLGQVTHCEIGSRTITPLNFPHKRYERNQNFKNVPSRSKSKFLFPPMSFLHKQQGEILTLLRVTKSIALVNYLQFAP